MNFEALARGFEGSGADIKDAVVMAAVIALDEPADRVAMRHFQEAARQVAGRYADLPAGTAGR